MSPIFLSLMPSSSSPLFRLHTLHAIDDQLPPPYTTRTFLTRPNSLSLSPLPALLAPTHSLLGALLPSILSRPNVLPLPSSCPTLLGATHHVARTSIAPWTSHPVTTPSSTFLSCRTQLTVQPTQPHQLASAPPLDTSITTPTSKLNLATTLSTDRTPAPHAYPVPPFLASRHQTPA